MPSKPSKWIAAPIGLALIVLYAALGILSGLLTGHPSFSKYFNDRPWFNLVLFIVGIIFLIVVLTLWQQGRTKEPLTREDLKAFMREAIEARYDLARREERIPAQSDQDKDAEITRLTHELEKLQQQVAARSSDPGETELAKCLAARDLDGALRVKTQQVETRRTESAKLPQDLYELGTIHELRFEWPQALTAFREAWELSKLPAHGFKYAHFAAKLNHFNWAIAAYEALLGIYTDPADRATTLNNLAILYRDTQRMKQAEEACDEALAIRRKLAETNGETFLLDVATTLNNLANLYGDTQRMKQAEDAYDEALATYRKLADKNADEYLPDVAMTLNNLAILYRDTQRMKQAEEAYDEALATRRKLAKTNPDTYLPSVATTLNNLAILYVRTQRMKEAEESFDEALATYRKLAETNPDTYLPDVAMTLNNLAVLYRRTQRMKQAEDAYDEALAIRRKLAETNRDTYLPDVARTLNNLGNLYGDTQRMKQAEEAYGDALAIRRKLAETNPDTYLPDVAMTLNNLAYFFLSNERIEEAQTHAEEAERILTPLWQTNPSVHGNQMARTLGTRALLAEAASQPSEACAFARRALAAAYDPVLKQTLQQLINRLCPPIA